MGQRTTALSNRPSRLTTDEVLVIGLGYVGLTLLVGLAEAGLRVAGFEVNAGSRARLERGEIPFHESGLSEGLRRHLGTTLSIAPAMPSALPRTVIICVGTPMDPVSHQPDLSHLDAATEAIAARLSDDDLVVVRSTVPIGTSRHRVLPILEKHVAHPLLAFCPERTIQGKALAELRSLPQVVGGITQEAAERARELFARLTRRVVVVSSLEVAEMVKLVNNSHTDLIYGFGNEVAMIAEAAGLDADEVIDAANLDYPRPDLSKPGFVGGSCLVKDPYLLIGSALAYGYRPSMVEAARALNEAVPGLVAERVLDALRAQGKDPHGTAVLISGIAYKGQPETDDVRGGPADAIVSRLAAAGCRLFGHDFVVSAERVASLGMEPSDLAAGPPVDAILILNNHVRYQDVAIEALATRMRPPGILFDAWGVFKTRVTASASDILYLRLGRG